MITWTNILTRMDDGFEKASGALEALDEILNGDRTGLHEDAQKLKEMLRTDETDIAPYVGKLRAFLKLRHDLTCAHAKLNEFYGWIKEWDMMLSKRSKSNLILDDRKDRRVLVIGSSSQSSLRPYSGESVASRNVEKCDSIDGRSEKRPASTSAFSISLEGISTYFTGSGISSTKE
jgi:hypothetical protein